MPEFLTDIHSLESGVSFTLRWKDEREYLLGKAFLKELLGDAFQVGANDRDRIPTYYFENDRLLDALYEFRRRLRGSAEPEA
jgi:hypothetical protein